MKNFILLSLLITSVIAPSSGQMSVAHAFPPNDLGYDFRVVNLALSGKKLAVVRRTDGIAGDTIFYYNTDYSLWKIIPCPAIPGYAAQTGFGPAYTGATGYISYSSETLFNTDTLLEVAVDYIQTVPSYLDNVYIINELGNVTDSITGLYGWFRVYSASPGVFIASVQRIDGGITVYNLPGTLPCDMCGSVTEGLGKNQDQEQLNILSSPIPNPSKNEVKITFTLPEGASRGELTIYSTTGQLMKSYTVDNRFGFIMVDDSQFAPGMYYYNLVANGVVSSTQKMLVIK